MEHAAARAVARLAARLRAPGGDESAAAKRRDRGQALGRLGLLVDQQRAVDARPVRRIALGEDAARGAVAVLEIGERHREAAARMADDVRLDLAADHLVVDEELRAHPHAAQVVALGIDALREAEAVVAIVRGERHHEAAVHRRHPRRELGARDDVVDPLRQAQRRAVGRKDLQQHAEIEVARIVAVLIDIDHRGLAVLQHRHVRRAQPEAGRVGQPELGPDRAALIAEALADDHLLERRLGLGLAQHHEVAVGMRRQPRRRLAKARRVDEQLAPHRRAAGVIDLRDDLRAALEGSRVVAPRDHEAAGGQPDDCGVELRADRRGVDLELAADRRARDVVGLGEHAAVVVAGRVLVGRFPDDHIARGLAGHGIEQGGDRRVGLLAQHKAVGLALVVHRTKAVLLRRDLQRHGPRDHAALSVADVQRQHARRRGIVGDVGVAQRLDHLLDPRRGGAGGEHDLQRRAVGAGRDQRAHGDAAHRHHAAGHADAAGRGQPQLVLRQRVGRGELLLHRAVQQHRQRQPPAVEGRAVGVAERRGREQQRWPGVRRRLVQRQRRGDPGQHRGLRGLGRAVDPLEHALARAVARGPGGVGLEGDHEAARPQRRHARRALRACALRVDDEVAVHARAVRGEDLRHDLAREAADGAEIAERHHPAAAGQRGDRGLVLRARGVLVHPRLAAHRLAGGVVALLEHARARAVEPAVVLPDHDEAAVAQRRRLRLELVARHGGVDAELGDHLDARSGDDARIDAELERARIVLVLRIPDRQQVAVRQLRQRRAGLVEVGDAVELELAGLRRARGVEHAAEHPAAGAVAGRAGGLRPPRRGEAAAAQSGQRRKVLRARCLLVDLELLAQRRPRRAERAAEHARAAAILARVAGEGHDEAAAGQPDHLGVALVRGGLGVDAELRPDRLAEQVVDLTEHAVRERRLRPVLAVAGPDHHMARDRAGDRVEQRSPRRLVLRASREAVDLGLGRDRRDGQVGLGRHRHRDQRAAGRAAVAVAHLHREGPHRRRRIAGIAVAKPGDHRLDPRRRGAGGEGDLERRAVRAVLHDLADGDAADRDRGAGHRHAAAGDQPELLLARVVGRAELGVEVARGADLPHDQQRAAVEVGAVGVGQPHRRGRVDQLQRGVDRVLGEDRRLRAQRQHRARLPGGRVDQRGEHARARPVAGRAGGEGAPRQRQRAGAQHGDCGLVLRGRGLLVDDEGRRGRLRVRPEALRHDVADGVVAVGDDEAAVVRARNRRLALA